MPEVGELEQKQLDDGGLKKETLKDTDEIGEIKHGNNVCD